MELLSDVVTVTLDVPRTFFSICRTIKRGVCGKSLDGKVVLVTGASSGIGRAVSKELFRTGCKLILASRDVEALQNLRRELITSCSFSQGGNAIRSPVVVVELDLSDDASTIGAASEAFSTYGSIDVLINCAGVSHRGSVNDTDLSVHRKVMQINYFGPLLLTSEILKLMMVGDQRCHVVNVSSLQGIVPVPFRSAYCASKHALQAFSDSLRMEINSDGLNALVTVVSPGYVNTNLSKNALTGSGEPHGVLDVNARDGFDASYVATEIVNGICLEEEEIIVAKIHHLLVVYLRRYSPRLFFRIMEMREAKSLSEVVNILTPTWLRSLTIKMSKTEAKC